MKKLPFEIPPFDPGKHVPMVRFDWWGWNPNYPYWSRSCWGGATEAEARTHTERIGMSCYAVKLVKEERGVFTVIEEFGPTDVESWHRIAKQHAQEAAKTMAVNESARLLNLEALGRAGE